MVTPNIVATGDCQFNICTGCLGVEDGTVMGGRNWEAVVKLDGSDDDVTGTEMLHGDVTPDGGKTDIDVVRSDALEWDACVTSRLLDTGLAPGDDIESTGCWICGISTLDVDDVGMDVSYMVDTVVAS